MTQIMRNSLRDTISGSLKSAHAGLLMQRGLQDWDSKNKLVKEKLIDRISQISASSLYQKAYDRWLKQTSDNTRFSFTVAKTVNRLYTGLSSATALETGLTTHHTYGMPMLAGSSVKGAVATYAEQIGLPENIRQVLFGDEDNSGAVIWHDAWWIPNSGKPFVEEIVTTHHQEYYRGKDKNNNPKILPDELEDPNPNQQIGCEGSFYFVVEAVNQAWATFATNLLLQMLENQGMGSKTASGYGYFEYDEEAAKQVAKDVKKIHINLAKSKANTLEEKLATLSEAELIANLSRDKASFFNSHKLDKDNPEDRKKMVTAILDNKKLAGYIESWRSQTNEKNKAKAVKFIDENK